MIEELHAAFTVASTTPLLAFASLFLSTMTKDEDEHDLLNELHPLTTLLSFLVAKSDQDMIKLYQALQEPDAAEFIKAMEKGVSDYEVVLISTIPRRNKLILAVWSMKHK